MERPLLAIVHPSRVPAMVAAMQARQDRPDRQVGCI
jgi:hypothetical protein